MELGLQEVSTYIQFMKKETTMELKGIGEYINELLGEGYDDPTTDRMLAEKLDIPKRVAKRILDQADNVTVWDNKKRCKEYHKIVVTNLEKFNRLTK